MSSDDNAICKEIETINEILNAINKAKTFQDAFIDVLDSFCSVLGFDGGSMHYVTFDDSKMEQITRGVIDPGFFQKKFVENFKDFNIEQNQQILCENIQEETKVNEKSQIINSYCFIPLVIDHKYFGIFQLASFSKRIFSQKELQIVSIVSREFARIIEKKLFETKILTSERNLKGLLNTTKELMLVISKEGSIIDANDTTSIRTEYSIEELKTMNVLDLHPKRFFEQAKIIFDKMVNKEIAFCDVPLITKSGKEFFVESYIQNGVWNNEDVFFGIIRDVSELQGYRESIEDLNLKLFSLLDNLPFIAWMKDNNGKYIAVNKPFADAVNLPFDQIIGKEDIELWFKNNDSIEIDLERKVMETGVPLIQERKFEFKDQIYWFEININPIYSGNRVIGATGIAKDVTERKNIESAIILSEANLNAVVESSEDAIASFNRDYKLVAFNKKYVDNVYQINGIRIKKGMHFNEFTRTVMQEFWKEMYDKAIAGEKIQKEITYKLSDSSSRYYKISINPIFNNEVSIGFTVFSSDITQIKRKEIELIEAKEMAEKASEAKQMFLSTITHEIRTPLNGIIGIANLISNESLSPELKEKIEMLQFSSNNLYALISDVLDISRIESGKIEIENINFNIKEFFENIYKSFLFKANEKGLKLNFDDTFLTHTIVSADQLRINQILVNLLGNSIKFTNKGFVSLSVETIISKNKEGVKIKVEDTGIGISEDRIDNIFELFVQADSTISQKFGGTGLGLAITKKLVELLDGWIDVKSKENDGATFEVFIPIRRVENLNILADNFHSQIDNLRGMKVLLVEDNELNQFVASKFLEKWQIEVDISKNGIECLKMIESKKYDLILMDLQMPEMDGYEASTIIRSMADFYFQNIPIIALTASAINEVREKALISGMNDFITKPFNSNELYNKLERYFRFNSL